MNQEMRDKIILAAKDATKAIGASNYDEAMKSMRMLLDALNTYFPMLETVETLRATLDSSAPMTESMEQFILQGIAQLPPLLRHLLKNASKTAASTLPAASVGRPKAATSQESSQIADYISSLSRRGCTLTTAKDRAAQKYNLSRRTIERIWRTRGTTNLEKLTLADLLRIAFEGMGSLS